MMKLEELIKLMRVTPLEKIEEFLKGLLVEINNDDSLKSVTCRCFYRATCRMYEDVQPKNKLQICKIIRTELCDIPPGTPGTILKEENGGYAIEVTALFKRADKLRSNAELQTKTFWFKKDEVEILPDEPVTVCSNPS